MKYDLISKINNGWENLLAEIKFPQHFSLEYTTSERQVSDSESLWSRRSAMVLRVFIMTLWSQLILDSWTSCWRDGWCCSFDNKKQFKTALCFQEYRLIYPIKVHSSSLEDQLWIVLNVTNFTKMCKTKSRITRTAKSVQTPEQCKDIISRQEVGTQKRTQHRAAYQNKTGNDHWPSERRTWIKTSVWKSWTPQSIQVLVSFI